MDSSSSKRNYPRLLYKKGKAPSQQRSMSYYSYLSNFQMVEEGVGLDGWDAWDDDVDDDDVTNLVHDISHNCVDRGFWDVNEEPPATTRKKRPTSVPETDVQSSKKKKANDTKTVGVEEDCDVSNKEETQMNQLSTLMKTLIGKLDNIDTSIETKIGVLLAPMNKKLATMEKELQKLKEKDVADDRKEDANSNVNEHAEVNSREMV
uniref:DUF287 domain-containing protein n=1 Tax=Brassica campestris TaxID=3711 RepID=A0A3P6ACE8_BRACM|nr:unnamed protein product [Brassica rapa]